MHDQFEHIRSLILKWLDDDITPAENEQLQLWRSHPGNQQFFEEITNAERVRTELNRLNEYAKNAPAALQTVLQAKANSGRGKIFYLRSWTRLVGAAVCLGVIITATIIYFASRRPVKNEIVNNSNTPQEQTIQPGRNKATLGRANGSTVDLANSVNGVIAKEQAADVTKTMDGELVYKSKSGKPEMNWIATPKGGQYQVTLPDGSKVKLNAESRLDYPTAFTGADRTVTLSGEAFFEVKKDPSKPFYVQAKNLNVKVTGTSFNLNTYGNEIIVKGTLFEGKITAGDDYVKFDLKPGEEIQYDSATKQYQIVKADLEGAAAWRNGLFNLENADIPTLFREISRWYAVDIVYAGEIPKGKSFGQIHRDLEFPELLRVLNQAGISTRVEGNKLIVL